MRKMWVRDYMRRRVKMDKTYDYRRGCQAAINDCSGNKEVVSDEYKEEYSDNIEFRNGYDDEVVVWKENS